MFQLSVYGTYRSYDCPAKRKGEEKQKDVAKDAGVRPSKHVRSHNWVRLKDSKYDLRGKN